MEPINGLQRPRDYAVIAFLGLCGLKGVGFNVLSRLYKDRKDFSELVHSADLTTFTRSLRDAGYKGTTAETRDWKSLQRTIISYGERLSEKLEERKIEVLFRDDPRYPEQLREISDSPPWLFIEGNIHVLQESSVAVVGTRKPSADGIFLSSYATLCCHYLAAPVVSGLAIGIDQIAHERSVASRLPTISVLGCGILKDYPASSYDLRSRIIEGGGAVISEYLPTAAPTRESFVRRNRLQAGLAKVVIPAEWSEKSGTAHTVRYAKGYGRVLVGLKLHSWRERPELEMLQKMGGKVFEIPGDEYRLLDELCLALRGKHLSLQSMQQLSFF